MRESEQGREGQDQEGANAAPPPAPSHQGDGEEAGTAPRPRQGESEQRASDAGSDRAEVEPRSEVHKINQGDKLDSIVPRRERDR